jgi:hypothetical protein
LFSYSIKFLGDTDATTLNSKGLTGYIIGSFGKINYYGYGSYGTKVYCIWKS